MLLERVKDVSERRWYGQQAPESGWSRAFLGHQIGTRLHARQMNAPKTYNFERTVPHPESEPIAQALKDLSSTFWVWLGSVRSVSWNRGCWPGCGTFRWNPAGALHGSATRITWRRTLTSTCPSITTNCADWWPPNSGPWTASQSSPGSSISILRPWMLRSSGHRMAPASASCCVVVRTPWWPTLPWMGERRPWVPARIRWTPDPAVSAALCRRLRTCRRSWAMLWAANRPTWPEMAASSRNSQMEHSEICCRNGTCSIC